MNKEAIYLLKILKCFVLGEQPETFDGDWDQLIQLAEIHSVIGILGYMVMSYPDESNAAVYGKLRKLCFASVNCFLQRAKCMEELIRQMDALEIEHLIFKGYVVRQYYPVPELRSFGDIDFLIRPEDRKKSDTLMRNAGFQVKTDWEPVYSYYRGDEYYEIHTDVMEVDVSDKADYRGYFRKIWEHAHLVGTHTWELSPEFHFLYLLTHIAKHISGSGAGIRMYMDIAVFIRHFGDTLDWDYIQGELQTLCLSDFANMVLAVVQDYFGVNSPIYLHPIDSQVLEDFMRFTMDGGIFGHVGRDSGLIHLKNQNRNEGSVSRCRTFLGRLFPSADELEKRYTYLKGRHWLLPAAWVHRFFRTRDAWGYHAKEAQSIMNTDAEEVLRLRRIYKEIGL